MKKLFYSLFAFAALALTNTSCSDELENSASANGNEVAVSFKVELENATGSRALIGDGTKAKNLFFAVFKAKDANALGEEIEALSQKAVPVKDDLTATINTRLVKGQSYNFVFWAQTENLADGTYYNVTNMGNIIVKYNANNRKANNEDRDAFYAVRKNLKVTGPINETITLKRPFAQVNVGTKLGSLAEAAKAEVNITKSQITIKQVATELDPYSGQVKSPTDVTYLIADIPTQKLKDVTIDGVTSDYEYLSMNYILVNSTNQNTAGVVDGAQQELVNAELSIYDNADLSTPVNTFAIPNVPVQRNWRTNIIGDILSETVTFNIVIDPKFDTDENGEDHNYKIDEKLAYAAVNGGTVTLQDNVTLDGPIEITNDVNMVVNLNGKTISFSGKEDKTLYNAIFCVKKGTLTINGDGTIDAGSGSAGNIAVWAGRGDATNDGKVIINGGHFKNGSASELIYAANKGIIEINGGTFEVKELSNSFSSPQYAVLNLYNNGKLGADIIVKGGTFVNFNPSDNVSEKPKKDFVATGYKSVKITDTENYIVVPEEAEVASKLDELEDALDNGGNIVLADDVTANAPLAVTGGTLDGNGKTITGNSGTSDYESGVTVQSGTLQNVTVTDAFRALGTGGSGAYEMTGDVYYKNVTTVGATYGINIGIGNNHNLYVENCTIGDWNSYSGLACAEFTNCTFISAGKYYAAQRISAGATFTYKNCTFEQNTYDNASGTEKYYLNSYSGTGTIVLKDCNMDGVAITAENVALLFQIKDVTVIVE